MGRTRARFRYREAEREMVGQRSRKAVAGSVSASARRRPDLRSGKAQDPLRRLDLSARGALGHHQRPRRDGIVGERARLERVACAADDDVGTDAGANEHGAATLETNRGCPFTCTFCVQGTKYYSKIHNFSVDRIKEEITYIARRIKAHSPNMGTLRIADSSVAGPHPDATDVAAFTSALATLGDKYDFVVVDTPSGENHLSLLAHALADTLITPINDSFVDLDVIGTMAPSSDFQPRRSRYAEMVAPASERRSWFSNRPTDWVVVRNRLPRLISRNQKQVAEMLELMAPELGFRTVRSLSDRVIFREFFPVGLTAFDPLDEAKLGLRSSMAHVMARSEVRELVGDIGLLPSAEKLDLESRVKLIVDEMKLPRATLLGASEETPAPADAPHAVV